MSVSSKLSDVLTALSSIDTRLQNIAPQGGYAEDIGDGTATLFTVTHSLGTRDVVVQLRQNASPWEYVGADVRAATTTTVTVQFLTPPAAGAYRILITRAG